MEDPRDRSKIKRPYTRRWCDECKTYHNTESDQYLKCMAKGKIKGINRSLIDY